MKKIFTILILFFVWLGGCTKKEVPAVSANQSPEEVIRAFVRLSGEAKELTDKNKLLEMCTGEMKGAFQEMNEDQFRLFYLNDNLNIQELKILSTNIHETEATITYQVVVENKQGTDVTKELNEREAVLKEGIHGWKIETVRPKGTDKLIFLKGMVF